MNMNVKNLMKLIVVFMMLSVSSVFASAIPVVIDSVDINGVALTSTALNRVGVERGQQLNVAVRLTGASAANNVEVEAFVSGFEFNDVERVSDATGVFDVLPNVTYVKRLVIPLPDSMEKDNYKLRIIVSDRNDGELINNYNIALDLPRHLVGVKDVLLTPENEITAGGALLVAVRVENLGAKVEEDVKIKVAIPELGVSATKYVSKVSTNDETESEDVYLRLPECATPGTYNVVATVFYADAHRTSVGSAPINVLKNELCDGDVFTGASQQSSKILISVGSNVQSVDVGSNAVFPITVSNNGRTSKSFTVLPVAGEWAELKISPTSTAVLAPGKSETFYVFVTPTDDAVTGSNIVTASVSSSGELLKNVVLTANVVKPSGQSFGIKRLLELGLIVLLVLLIIVGLIVGFTMLKKEDDIEPPRSAEPYY